MKEMVERLARGAVWLRDHGMDNALPHGDFRMPETMNEWLVSMAIIEIIPGKVVESSGPEENK